MTEKEYTTGRAKAIPVLVRLGYSRALAEDAVQTAAIYFLERTYPRVTPSLFTQVARLRAAHIHEAAYGSDRAHGKARREIFAGDSIDLAATEERSPVCGIESHDGNND